MKPKRWWALLTAVVLIVFSIIINIGKTSELRNKLAEPFQEAVIEDGNPLNKIAVIEVEGTIMDMGSDFFGESEHQRLLQKLETASEDPRVKAVLLYVNSPGGGVVESAEIHDKVLEIKEAGKPVYASMGNTAASGGYYVSAPADKIYAHPATLTGSIGVIIQSINVAELADDLGIDVNTIKSGKHKDILSATRKMTEEEEEILQSMVDDMYEDFVNVVAEGRDFKVDKVKSLADGRVYTGKQAQENGLVDELGTKEEAIEALKVEADIKDPLVFKYEDSISFGSFFSVPFAKMFKKDQDIEALMEILDNLDGPRAMYLYSR